MAAAVVQSVSVNAVGFVNTVTTGAFGSSTTTGNTIVVFSSASSNSADITSVTDSQSNVYSRISQIATGSVDIECWIARNITGGASHTITTNDTGFLLGGIAAYEVSGLTKAGVILDKVVTGSGNGGTLTGNLPTTTNSNDLLLMGGVISIATGTWTVGTLGSGTGINGLTATGSSQNLGTETHVETATGSYSGTLTNSVTNQNYVFIVIALSDALSTPLQLNNYQFVRVGDGMSTGERIR